ncbi:hypothetical protein ADUPG1_000573, partial [Aduncisulcus paluster]
MARTKQTGKKITEKTAKKTVADAKGQKKKQIAVPRRGASSRSSSSSSRSSSSSSRSSSSSSRSSSSSSRSSSSSSRSSSSTSYGGKGKGKRRILSAPLALSATDAATAAVAALQRRPRDMPTFWRNLGIVADAHAEDFELPSADLFISLAGEMIEISADLSPSLFSRAHTLAAFLVVITSVASEDEVISKLSLLCAPWMSGQLARTESFAILVDGIQFFSNCFAHPWGVDHRDTLLLE